MKHGDDLRATENFSVCWSRERRETRAFSPHFPSNFHTLCHSRLLSEDGTKLNPCHMFQKHSARLLRCSFKKENSHVVDSRLEDLILFDNYIVELLSSRRHSPCMRVQAGQDLWSDINHLEISGNFVSAGLFSDVVVRLIKRSIHLYLPVRRCIRSGKAH